MDDRSMLPDPGRYEERYRMTTGAVPVVAVSLVLFGLLFRTEALWATEAIIALALAVLLVPAVAARRLVAFRADYAGVLLGAEPRALMAGRGRPVFIPWHEVDQIVLHPDTSGLPGAKGQVGRIEVRRRTVPPAGDEQAQEPGTAAVTRSVRGWRLDRERLALITGAVAPGVPVIEAAPGRAVAGPGAGTDAGTDAAELGTAD
jgi:hypothetical protein